MINVFTLHRSSTSMDRYTPNSRCSHPIHSISHNIYIKPSICTLPCSTCKRSLRKPKSLCTAWKAPCHTIKIAFYTMVQAYLLPSHPLLPLFLPFNPSLFWLASPRVPPSSFFTTAVHSICISVTEELFLWWQRLSPWSILVWHHNTTRRSESRALCLLMGRSPPTGSSTACILSCFHLILSPCLLLFSFLFLPLSSSAILSVSPPLLQSSPSLWNLS